MLTKSSRPRCIVVTLLALCAQPFPVSAQLPVTTREIRRADSLSTKPRIGDTVRVSGRVILGSGVIDSSRLRIYVQDSTGAVYVRAEGEHRHWSLQIGEAVTIVGVVGSRRGYNQLDALRVVASRGPRHDLAPLQLRSFRRAELDSAGVRLVSVEGVITRALLGRGERALVLAAPGDTATVLLLEEDDGDAALRFDRFSPGDRIRVTGVLTRQTSSSGPRYTIYPRALADLQAIGLTDRTKRRFAYTSGILLLVGSLATMLVRVRRLGTANRKREENALREDADRHKLMVQQAPAGMVIYRDGKIVLANAEFARIVGAPSAEILRDVPIITLVHPDERKDVEERMRRILTLQGQAGATNRRLLRLDGSVVETETTSVHIHLEGRPAVQAVVHDVGERKKLEAQLRQAQKMEAVGQLAAGIAHDFNNILTVVSSYSELVLAELPVDSPARVDIEEIRRASTRAVGLTRQLLSFSRRDVVQLETLDVNVTVRETQKLLRRTIGEQITLEASLTSYACTVLADRGQLEQVLMNLVLNARDAMAELGGTLTIQTAVHSAADVPSRAQRLGVDKYVMLSVRDTGVGMTAEALDRIFEPFFTTKPPGEGTGLGLATVYGIVTQADGSVWAESQLGEGTVFYVVLPRATASVQAHVEKSSWDTGAAKLSATVLLVEDEAPVRTSVARSLTRQGFTVLQAKNAHDAMMVWQELGAQIDVVVTDVVMPGMRGPEMANRLRADRPALPILFISGYTDHALGTAELAKDRTTFLAKPFSIDELVSAVRRVTVEQERLPVTV